MKILKKYDYIWKFIIFIILVSAEKVAYVMHICECRKQTACYSANKL